MDEETVKYKFGQCLAVARKRNRVTQENLCDKTGFMKNTVSDMERGKSNSRLLTIYTYAQAAGISLAEVFYEFENMPPICSERLHELVDLLRDKDDDTINDAIKLIKLFLSSTDKAKS